MKIISPTVLQGTHYSPQCSPCKSMSQMQELLYFLLARLWLIRPCRYRPPRGSDDGSNPESERKVPAGIPYLTKINGKLVMAREKKDKAYSKLDLLGEAFGVSARIARRKSSPESSKSNDSTETLVLPAPEQQPQIAYTSAPIPQQYYPPMLMPGNQQVTHYQPPQQIMQGPQRPPTQQELDQLCRIDEGLQRRLHGSNEIAGPEHSCRKCSERNETFTRTTITMTRHVCANCGRIRSRKYHHEHPIKPGEVPEPAFCRKCQKYASSTSGSDHGGKGKQGKKDRKEKKLQKHGKVCVTRGIWYSLTVLIEAE